MKGLSVPSMHGTSRARRLFLESSSRSTLYFSMTSAPTLRVGREGKPLHAFRRHALALLHVPERDQLRHTDQASEVTQRGRLEPLPIIHVRHEIPGVLLHVAGNLLALDVIGRNRPF